MMGSIILIFHKIDSKKIMIPLSTLILLNAVNKAAAGIPEVHRCCSFINIPDLQISHGEHFLEGHHTTMQIEELNSIAPLFPFQDIPKV